MSNANTGRVLVWFSCGAASAVALKLALEKYPEAKGVYCDLRQDEHPDNERFMRDVEAWTGSKIEIIKSSKYNSITEAFAHQKYMSGIAGARCTLEMKKYPRVAYQQEGDLHIFGLTVDEISRINTFEKENQTLLCEWILRDNFLGKRDCLAIIRRAGIEIPMMYKLGFQNNNCIGCVKAQSPWYWNRIRSLFPEQWEQRNKQSRDLGVRLAKIKGKRVFLDEIPVEENEYFFEDLSCGPQCKSNK